METTKKPYKKLILDLFLLGLAAVGLTVLSFLFVAPDLSWELFFRFIFRKKLLFLNFLPIMSLLLILYFASGRFWFSFLFTGLALVAMGTANMSKLHYREEVLKLVDLTLIKEATIMVGNDFKILLPPKTLAVGAFVLVGTILAIKFLKYRVKGTLRWLGLLLSLVFAFGSFKVTTDDGLYNETRIDGFNQWVDVEKDKARGMVYAFVHSYKGLITYKPLNYDQDYAEKTWDKYEDSPIPADRKINYIVLMLESFNDFSRYGVDFVENPYASYEEVKKESVSGDLLVNVFGGGTINTERSFILGTYGQPTYSKKTNSYVWYMRSQGYNTVAMHPHMGTFYNRRNTNMHIGYERFLYSENYFDDYWKKTYDMADTELFKHILKDYRDHKETGKPYFNMTVTMQNHGPYEENSKVKKYIDRPAGLDENIYNQLNHYFNGMKITSDALKTLIDELRADDEPVVVIAFGDHNPFLGKEEAGFRGLGIDVDPNSVEGYLNKYKVPYLVWANDQARDLTGDDFVGHGPTLSPQFLMDYVFTRLNIQGPKLMQIKRAELTEVTIYNDSYTKIEDDFMPTSKENLEEIRKRANSIDYYYNTHFIYEDVK